MRISEFSVISVSSVGEFGALRGVSGTLAPRLSVVWGGNGSGKTTLSHFFRRLMFAGPYGSEIPRYEGAMLIHMSDGRNLKIERDGRKNLIGDAGGAMAAMPEDFLPFDAETYESVFAVNPGLWPVLRRPAACPVTWLDELEHGITCPPTLNRR